MTNTIKKVKRLIFSSSRTVLQITTTDEENKTTCNYRITRADDNTNKYFVWGREHTRMNMHYVGIVYPHRSDIHFEGNKHSPKNDFGGNTEPSDIVYRMIKFFMMTLFNEYPWMDTMHVNMTSTCGCCNHESSYTINTTSGMRSIHG